MAYALQQNYPNPFNPTTTVRYLLPLTGHVTLKIYNVLGQEVVTLIGCQQEAGDLSVEWNASNVASGAYFHRITANGGTKGKMFSDVKKMIFKSILRETFCFTS